RRRGAPSRDGRPGRIDGRGSRSRARPSPPGRAGHLLIGPLGRVGSLAVEGPPAVGEPGAWGELQPAPVAVGAVRAPVPTRLAGGDGEPVRTARIHLSPAAGWDASGDGPGPGGEQVLLAW